MAGSGAAAAGTGGCAVITAILLSPNEILIPDYKGALVLAIREASEWTDQPPPSPALLSGTEKQLEHELVKQVRASSKFAEHVDNEDGTGEVWDQTESARCGSGCAHNQCAPVQGEGDPVTSRLPWYERHRRRVRGYWKLFTALPNAAILLLDFKNDVKTEQVNMYKAMEESLEIKVIVAFCKVDEKFTRRNRGLLTEEYFINLKRETARNFGCLEAYIFYIALEPDLESEEAVDQLRAAMVLDFSVFFKEVESLV